MSDDNTKAEAPRLARAHLEKLGWRYSAKEIGKTAREILDAFYKGQSHE